MEIILSILIILGIIGLFKFLDGRASDHLNIHITQIDYGKKNGDRIINDISILQVNQNHIYGKYDKK